MCPLASLAFALALSPQETYKFGVKKAVFEYNYRDPSEQEQLSALNLPPPVEKPAKLKGTVDVATHNFARARNYIAENLFFTHHLLYNTLYSIIDRWRSFSDQLLVNTELADLPLPCELAAFKQYQFKVVDHAAERLKHDWVVSVSNTIQSDLDEHFNFYEDNVVRYRQSRMSRFFRTVCVHVEHTRNIEERRRSQAADNTEDHACTNLLN